VRRHLIRLFNTHEGSAPGCPEYGLPDLRALSQLVRNDRAVVEELLRSRIAKFEPRLVGVEVRYVDPRDAVPGRGSASASAEDLFLAHFQVRGQLVEAGQGGQKLVNRGVFAMEMEQDAKGQIKLSSSRNS
jgi:type VI secretion system lysozyme-like protein